MGTAAEIATIATVSGQRCGESAPNAVDISDYTSVEGTMRQVSENLYEVLDENGEVFATYEPGMSTDKQPRLGWTIDWTVKSGVQTGANSQFESFDGLTFTYELEFSRTGSSKIGYAKHETKTIVWVETSSDGFDGGFTLTRDMGLVSLALKNDSSNTITYSGTYYVFS